MEKEMLKKCHTDLFRANALHLKNESERILSACMAVHRELGCGFLEPVYQEALAWELTLQNIPFDKEKRIDIFYKGQKINREYYADFVCFGNIILELKSVSRLVNAHTAQLLNYLNATKLNVGFLINFGEASLKWKRVTNFKSELPHGFAARNFVVNHD